MSHVVSDPDTTDDAFLGGRLNLLQLRHALRAGLDAVFLAAAVPVSSDNETVRVLDVGAGCGVAGLSVLTRAPQGKLTGIDINADLIALARQNADRNALANACSFHIGDVRSIRHTMTTCELQANSFDHVLANPPYFESGTVQNAPNATKDRANVMNAGDLDLWVRFMTHAAKAGGVLSMVHKADALSEILKVLDGRFGDVRIFPLFPRVGTAASRVLVQGRKGSRAPMTLLPGLVLHGSDGGFTPGAERVLRHGEGLSLDEHVA